MSPAEWCMILRPGYIPDEDKSTVLISNQNAEAKTPILWPPDENWLIGKDSDSGKDWRQEEKGVTEDGIIGWLRELVWTGKPCAAVHGVTNSQTWLRDELNCTCIRWPKNWNFSFSISASNDYSGLISFRIDWLDLFAIQGTLKSLLQHHSSKTSVLQCSTFFMVHLSHPYMTTGKTIALTRWTFVNKVMSLLFNMLSMLVIAFLPRSKCLLISWLQSPSAVILETKKKSLSLFPLFPHLFSMKWWDWMPWC